MGKKSKKNKSGSAFGKAAQISRLLNKVREAEKVGDLALAESSYRKILEKDSRNITALNGLAGLAIRSGMDDVALDILQHALSLGINDATSLVHLGGIYSRQGLMDLALESFESALLLEPENPLALAGKGGALFDKDQLLEAHEILNRALKLDPTLGSAALTLAKTLVKLNKPDEAIDVLGNISKYIASEPMLYFVYGEVFEKKQAYDSALEAYEAALSFDPQHKKTLNSMAILLMSMGRREEAANAFRKLLEIDPDSTAALYGLLNMDDASIIERLDHFRDLIERQDVIEDARRSAGYALGKYYEKQKDYAKAMQFFRRASELKHAVYEREAHERLLTESREIFSSEFVESVRLLGHESKVPVFVLGMPRSGTSLVENFLAAHSEVYGAGELSDIGFLSASLKGYVGTGRDYPMVMPDLDANKYKALQLTYLKKLTTLSANSTRVVDKMPTNFMFLGLICVLFPNARIIHCQRNALDVAISCYGLDFQGNLAWSYDFGDFAHFYRLYEQFMQLWSERFPENLLHVSYEELVTEPEEKVRAMIEHIGLDWEDQVLEAHRKGRAVRTASMAQVDKPVYTSSKNKWHKWKEVVPELLELFPEFTGKEG